MACVIDAKGFSVQFLFLLSSSMITTTSDLKKYGFFAVRDSGPPRDGGDYTTLIIFHGFGWHSAVFAKFFPLVTDLNVRVVTVNRRDYPGSTPLSETEREKLDIMSELTDKVVAAKALREFIENEASKVYDFLVKYVSEEDIPVDGGIIVAGWSFGIETILGLLANIEKFSANEVKLRPYIKHAVLYGKYINHQIQQLTEALQLPDGPYHTLGFLPHPDGYNPLFDPALSPGEGPRIFPGWISGYYSHGDDLSVLEFRDALPEPLPTILSMDPLEVHGCLELSPTLPGGSDDRLLMLGIKLGVFAQIRDEVIYLTEKKIVTGEGGEEEEIGKEWNDLELRYVWCDQSAWEMPWGKFCLQAELEEGKRAGKMIRKIEMVRLRGGNHFYHWDQPALALRGLLS